MQTPLWYNKAKRFILEQRQKELERAVKRYPGSDRHTVRVEELKDIERQLKELD